MKRLGFLTGAALAAIGVWAFYALTEVTDDDRLASVLLDHCIPFVQTGAAPFSDQGRAIGVYDGVALYDSLSDGGAKLIFDNRFLAQWGTVIEDEYQARACIVDDIYLRADSLGFEVAPVAVPSWVATNILPQTGLVVGRVEFSPPPNVMSWVEEGAGENEGLRVFLTGQSLGVSNVVVLDDLPD